MSMTDLHTHILPGMDDGAETVEVSLGLLDRQRADGVMQIAMTPHFHFRKENIGEFLARRESAFQTLRQSWNPDDRLPEVKLGAEVFYSQDLDEVDVRPLCLEGTDYLLVEFHPAYYPQGAADVLYQLTREGITPLIAHVERYAFVQENPNFLSEWIDAGACTQMNATSLLMHPKRQKQLLSMIDHGLIHVLSTDTHSLHKRPPMLREALELVEKKCGEDRAELLRHQATQVFLGEKLQVEEPRSMKKLLGKWW